MISLQIGRVMPDLVHQALDLLGEDEREVAGLLLHIGLTRAEAAEILGVSEDTVMRRWARAKIRLNNLLRADDRDE